MRGGNQVLEPVFLTSSRSIPSRQNGDQVSYGPRSLCNSPSVRNRASLINFSLARTAGGSNSNTCATLKCTQPTGVESSLMTAAARAVYAQPISASLSTSRWRPSSYVAPNRLGSSAE